MLLQYSWAWSGDYNIDIDVTETLNYIPESVSLKAKNANVLTLTVNC